MLFSNTIGELKKLYNDIKRIGFVFSVAMQIINMVYLLYACIVGNGFLWVNIVLFVVTLAYFIVYLIAFDSKNPLVAKINQKARHIKKWIVIAVKAFTLGVAIYGLYSTANNVNFVSMLLVIFMLLGWVAQILIELFSIFIEKQIQIIKTAFLKDVEPFIKVGKAVAKPVKAVTSVGSKIKGFFTKSKKEKDFSDMKLLTDESVVTLSKKEMRKLKKEERKMQKQLEKQNKNKQ